MCVCASSLTVVDCVYRPGRKFKSNSDKQENVRIKTHDSHLSVLRYREIFDFATYKHILNIILLLVLFENRFVLFSALAVVAIVLILFIQFYPATSASTSLVGWFFFSSCASNTFTSNKKENTESVLVYTFLCAFKRIFFYRWTLNVFLLTSLYFRCFFFCPERGIFISSQNNFIAWDCGLCARVQTVSERQCTRGTFISSMELCVIYDN